MVFAMQSNSSANTCVQTHWTVHKVLYLFIKFRPHRPYP